MKRLKSRIYSRGYSGGQRAPVPNRPPVRLSADAAIGAVRNLQELYTVAVGVAIALAMETVVKSPETVRSSEAFESPWGPWPMLIALLLTLIPFYHGAMRHLDSRYVEKRGEGVRRGALLADFIILFVEAGILTGMALQLQNIESFAIWFGVLLLLDAVWGLLVHVYLVTASTGGPEFRWAALNVFAAITLGLTIAWARASSLESGALCLAIGVPAVALIRSAIDYWSSWSFYFPGAEGPREVSARGLVES